MKRYMKRKLAHGKFPNPFVNWSVLVFTKIVYMCIWIVIPILVLNLVWWKILIGFFLMHYVAGLILSVIFQLAHVMDEADMPLPDEDGNSKKYMGNTSVDDNS